MSINYVSCLFIDYQTFSDFIEAGTWREGQSILALATLHVTNSLTHRRVIVADSFQGLPRPMHSEDLKDEFKLKALLIKRCLKVSDKNFQSLRPWKIIISLR